MNQPDAMGLTPVKQALLKIESLRRELEASRADSGEPIAIVGMGCRLPGGVNSPDELWAMLAAGTDAIGEVPPERWTDALYDPRPGRADTSYSRHGGFIDAVDRFDPAFFGISAREAARIDPQQRLLLECSWRAAEDAGFTRETLAACQTGVFVGSSVDDYARISEHAADEFSYAQTSLGTARPFAAGRIAYLFGLHGPALHLDTACSSSLVAVHLACQSLRAKESDVALAGGVNLMLSPEMTIALSELQALSPGGRCRTFDAAADGYVRGEGCGVLTLMRLSDAIAQHRPIRAVIRGSALNHDGRSNGMTAPNGTAQREVIRAALARAGISPAEVDYVEAHGTGTPLGDPIELRALEEVYCRDVARAHPLYVGSIKTNIGHLESAASVSGLMKLVCALQHGELPRHLHCDTPTAHVDWARNGIRVVTEPMRWPSARQGARVAAISSFGMSGTNGHLIVEAWQAASRHDGEAPPPSWTADEDVATPPDIFPVSAHSGALLTRAIADCATQLKADRTISPAAYGFALRAGRDTQRHRSAVVASSREALIEALESRAQAIPSLESRPAGAGRLAFLMTGQGAQRIDMAKACYRQYRVFREVFDECDRHVTALGELSLVDVLWGDEQARIDHTRHTQPAMFAVELALATLWMHWGVVPDALMGHSIGEYAAACVAGVFSIEDGCRLVVARGRLMETLTGAGAMLAVLASAQDVQDWIAASAESDGPVAIAADNGPANTVVAGEPAAIEAFSRRCREQGVATRALDVTRAFHSPAMAPMLAAFADVAASVQFHAPRIRLVSNVSAGFETTRLLDPRYWVEHVSAPVAFRAGMDTLLDDAIRTFVEIGPGGTLVALASACIEARAAGALAGPTCVLRSLGAPQQEAHTLLLALASLYEAGWPVDWTAYERSLNRPATLPRLVLPPYPLDEGRYWVGPRVPATRARPLSGAMGVAPGGGSGGLLGARLELPDSRAQRYEGRFAIEADPWLDGHRVQGHWVAPAAAFVDMALDAVRRGRSGEAAAQGSAGHGWIAAQALTFERALRLTRRDAAFALGTVVESEAGGDVDTAWRIAVYARPIQADAPAWVRHSTAQAGAAAGAHGHECADAPPLAGWHVQCTSVLPVEAFYARLAELGLGYSGAFRSIRQLVRGELSALSRIELAADDRALAAGVVQPALLDCAFQSVAAAVWDTGTGHAHVPVALGRIVVRPCAERLAAWCAVRVRPGRGRIEADIWLYDDDGACFASIERLTLAAVDARAFGVSDAPPAALAVAHHRIDWPAIALAAEPADLPARWTLFAGGSALDAGLLERCRESGWPVHCVPASRPARVSDAGADADADADQAFEFDDDAWLAGVREACEAHVAAGAGAGRLMLLYVWPRAANRYDDDAASPEAALAEALHAQRRFAAWWRIVQAIDWASCDVGIGVLTQGALALPGSSARVEPDQAAGWGAVRSLMHESGPLHVALADLSGPDREACSCALAALSAASRIGETQFAVRGAAVHGARLVERPLEAPVPLASGAYLVTGGRGAIGVRLIEWLIGQRVPKVVAVSRGLPDPALRDRLCELAEAHAVQLAFESADLACYRDVVNLVERIGTDRQAPLVGILHAAGVLEDGLLDSQPAAAVRRVLAPKVAGTRHLDRATAHLPLKSFVTFSSIVACIGSPGQSAYAAANAWMDGLMHERQAAGRPGHTINWGLWDGRGMAEQLDARQRERIAAYGLGALDPDAALVSLAALIGEPAGQSLVWCVDPERLAARGSSPALPALLGPLLRGPGPVQAGAARAEGLRDRVLAAPAPARRALLREHLLGDIATTLRTPVGQLDADRPLIELGLDSLMAGEFRSALRRQLGVDIPFGRLLEGATLDDVVVSALATLSGARAAAHGDHPHTEVAAPQPALAIDMEGGEL
ncbi:type I polyketide synthase [Burkholderia sp. Ac-20379]|uniref:type I polyketide synthase n=1 Tax=Burkholderia sp. Ac-20379 TaxID=2703900 RepID=UPI00197EBB4C|nr:type I polyketide synthase [Burkholderia sp. Ac-20379]MBN3723240.1 acyltransferase domain-containing protein [Burkholderia sp. Ac-20379]